MKKYVIDTQGYRYKRITRQLAKQYYNGNLTVVITPEGTLPFIDNLECAIYRPECYNTSFENATFDYKVRTWQDKRLNYYIPVGAMSDEYNYGVYDYYGR